jgi:hypothetical protein
MFRIILLLIIIALILAFKFLPWYVLVALAVVFVLSMKFLGKKLILWLFSLPFRAKGAALRGATVEVHSIAACAPPERPVEESNVGGDEEGSDDGESPDEEAPPGEGQLIACDVPTEEPRNYYRVEATITPGSKKQLFQHWEIGEVGLVLPKYSPFGGNGDDSCRVEALEVELDGAFTPDDGYKLMGPQRLRFVAGVKPGVDRLVFHYYFEKFGELLIPAVAGELSK